jgi:3-hydroxyisobutyrate dehydrogenase-like beta-hydroxyacid dehydrogenase
VTTPLTIGIFSPGAMGSALGRSWCAGGARVVSTVAGRSDRTLSLAHGLELLPSLNHVVDVADVVVSIGLPAHAVVMATEIAASCKERGRHPLVADLNAIAPATVSRVAEVLSSGGCELLDGSISGGPPNPTTRTRLYLSGPSASRMAQLVAPGLVAQVVGETVGLASAVKMCTAAMYKGVTALLLQSLQTAQAFGVTDVVIGDLQEQFGDLLATAPARIASAASKADRYPGEMYEIAATQRDAGAEGALYEAMAKVYESVGATALARLTPEAAAQLVDLAAVLDQLGRPAGSAG